MHGYIILETKKDPVSFRKKKREKKRKEHFCMKKKEQINLC